METAGVELTLLDCARYFHKVAGVSGLAQIVKDLGAKANAKKLAQAAQFYENTAARRLGYLLDCFGHAKQSISLEPFAAIARTSVLLAPSVKPLTEEIAHEWPRVAKWKLIVNTPVEVDD